MATVQDRLTEIEGAGANLDAVDAARTKLVEEHDGDESARAAVAESLYRLGLSALLRKKDLDAATDLFKRAADKKDPQWSPMARTSYALTLHAKQKYQQAVFELRKVIGQPGGTPTAHAATAQVLLCTVLRDAKAKPSEIEKADKERITALDALVKAHGAKDAEGAYWRLLLAMAHKEGGSRSECKKQLEAVVAMGEAAGADTLFHAKDLLKGM